MFVKQSSRNWQLLWRILPDHSRTAEYCVPRQYKIAKQKIAPKKINIGYFHSIVKSSRMWTWGCISKKYSRSPKKKKKKVWWYPKNMKRKSTKTAKYFSNVSKSYEISTKCPFIGLSQIVFFLGVMPLQKHMTTTELAVKKWPPNHSISHSTKTFQSYS